jgi:Interleukin-like EMT inducer
VSQAWSLTPNRRSLLLLFAVLAAIHTWPLLPQAASHSLDDGDSLLNGWLLASVARALATHPLTFFDINSYYPYHHSLATLDHQLGAVIFTGPVYLVSGNPQLALNLYTFATFVLGGVFCAMLAAEITGSFEAGLLAGSLFAFSSGRMENMNHSHVLGNFWLPLAMLLMHRYFAEPTWRRLAAAVAAALLLALTAWYNAALGPLALAIVTAAWVLRQRTRAAGAIGRLAVGAIVAGIVIAAVAIPYTRVTREFRSPPLRYWNPAGDAAPDTTEHRTISSSVIQDNSTGIEAFAGVRETASAPWLTPFRKLGLVGGRFFPGIVGAALALVAVILLFRAQARASWLAWPALALAAIFAAAVTSLAIHRFMGWPLFVSRSDWFFATLLASFVVWIALPMPASPAHPWLEHARTYFVVALAGGALSLGVSVYLSGKPIAHGIYPANAPGFDLLRAPVRFGALFALGSAVLAACGYAALTRRLQGRVRLAAGLCALLLVNAELFAPMPRMRRVPRVPEVYAWLRRAPEGAVVEFPQHGNLWSLQWSLAHRQPLAQGYGLVEPPAFARLRDDDELSPAMVEHIREYLHARYIVVDRTRYTGEDETELAANIAKNEGTLTKVAEGNGREVYEIGGPSRGSPVLRAYLPWMVAGARGVSVEADLDPVRAGVPHVLQVWGNGQLLASAPWQPGAPVSRMFAPLPPGRDEGVNVEVLGDYAARPAEISIEAGARIAKLQVNGHLWYGRTGYTLAVIAPDGRVDDIRTFNTSWFASASHELATRIAAIPQGWTAALATNYDASRVLTAEAVEALHTLGMTTDLRGRFRVMHAAIGIKGAAPGTAAEQVSPDTARCANGQPATVPVSVRDVRIY